MLFAIFLRQPSNTVFKEKQLSRCGLKLNDFESCKSSMLDIIMENPEFPKHGNPSCIWQECCFCYNDMKYWTFATFKIVQFETASWKLLFFENCIAWLPEKNGTKGNFTSRFVTVEPNNIGEAYLFWKSFKSNLWSVLKIFFLSCVAAICRSSIFQKSDTYLYDSVALEMKK